MQKICVITGTRAEYGILYPLLRKLQHDSRFSLQILATGTHLSPYHGMTENEIEKDGFNISKRVEILVIGDTKTACVKSTGLALMSLGDALHELKPDLLIALGDRFEMFAAVSAATLLNIPVCHIAGGELTEGAFDDALRHSITKMSALHFTTHERYRQRVIQMGANPRSVFNVGSLAIDNIRNEPMLPKKELENFIGFNLEKPLLLMTYHPETRAKFDGLQQLKNILAACEKIEFLKLIITEPNADPGSAQVKQLLHEFVQKHPARTAIFPSLGRRRFLSLLQMANGIIGNSSSGISEAPALGVGTINVGNRQKGRLMPKSVLNPNFDENSIAQAIQTILNPDFYELAIKEKNFYGDGTTAEKMVEILAKALPLTAECTQFYDLKT